MERIDALAAFGALSQETRLEVFRMLVRAGQEGMTAGEISASLDVKPNTLSANLSSLTVGGLLTRTREGRSIRYHANFNGVRDLLAYLLEDCCGGRPEACANVLDQILPETKP